MIGPPGRVGDQQLRGAAPANGSGAPAAMASGSTERIWSRTWSRFGPGKAVWPVASSIEDDPQREDVAGRRRRLAADLLGGQVPGRAEEPVAQLGQPQLGRLVATDRRPAAQPAGQAEVEDLHQPVVGDHHVLRLEVPVHDAGRVSGRHARGDLAGDRQERLGRQPIPAASWPIGRPAMYSIAMIGTPAVSSTA